MLLPLLLLAQLPRLAAAVCDCGFSVPGPPGSDVTYWFTESLESNFTSASKAPEFQNWFAEKYAVQGDAAKSQLPRNFSPNNVASCPAADKDKSKACAADDTKGLALTVGSKLDNGAVPSSELSSKRKDMHYGSYRAGMKLTAASGTCGAFFWYFDDSQEIDIEFLSSNFDKKEKRYPISLAVHTKESRAEGYGNRVEGKYSKQHNLPFDPTEGFHEYRFDYVPGSVLFYIDSSFVAELGNGTLPTSPGHLSMSHWSSGDPFWSHGPPSEDARLTVSYVKAFFNTTGAPKASGACSAAASPSCAVPGMDAANASTGGSFFRAGASESEASAFKAGWLMWMAPVAALTLVKNSLF